MKKIISLIMLALTCQLSLSITAMSDFKIINKTTKPVLITFRGAIGTGTSLNPLGQIFENVSLGADRRGAYERNLKDGGTFTIVNFDPDKEKVKVNNQEIPERDLRAEGIEIHSGFGGSIQVEPFGKEQASRKELSAQAESREKAVTDFEEEAIIIGLEDEIKKNLNVSHIEKPTALDYLNLKPGASKSDIERSYRKLIMVWHPDKHKGKEKIADATTKKLNTAHEEALAQAK